MQSGIVGWIINSRKKYIQIKSAVDHYYFNNLVDIDTHLPILVGQIFHPSGSDKVLCVFELQLNPRPKNNENDVKKVDNEFRSLDIGHFNASKRSYSCIHKQTKKNDQYIEQPLDSNVIEALDFFMPQVA